MEMAQFRILYRKFLFRMVDIELLSPQSDISKLLGQFASLLIFVSMMLCLAPAIGMAPAGFESTIAVEWSFEHFLIASTMLAVGLFAVISWNSTFLDQHDVLVLAPLPVRTRTLFGAKVAAVAVSLMLVVVLLNVFTSIAWTAKLASHPLVRSVPVLTSDPALPPVEVSELKPLVDRDLAGLKQATGIIIGVTKEGRRTIFAHGNAEPHIAFEIGSMRRIFSGRLTQIGAARMTAADLLTYLEANLHPERFPSLSAALRDSQVLRATIAPAWKIGPGPEQIATVWFYDTASESYWYSAEGGGRSSLAFFNPKGDYAAVILLNGDNCMNLVGRIGLRI